MDIFARRWFSSVYDKIRCRFGLFAAGMPAWMVGRLSVLVLSGMSFCLFVSAGCKAGGARMAEDLPAGLFQDGDLAFRRGTGLTSRVVLAADKSGAYSHVGILKWMDGKWHVIHAVPGEPDYRGDEDRVKAEAIESFFARTRAASGAVMRVEDAPEPARRAAGHARRLFRAGVLFDHEYDLTDTVRMYCTELVDYVYKLEGVDLSEERLSKIDIPLFDGYYLLPNDIARSERLRLIYVF